MRVTSAPVAADPRTGRRQAGEEQGTRWGLEKF